MADPWALAKRVIIWNAEPPPDAARPADATSVLLSRIARAARAGDGAEVDRFCRHALRDAADPFIPAAFLVARLLNGPNGADEAESLILSCGPQQHPERRAYAAALSSHACALREQRAPSERLAAEALDALQDVDDDAFVGVVEMRLALAAAYRGDTAALNDLAVRAANRLERAGAYTWAAAALTCRYLPNLDLGDLRAVRELLERAARLAELGGSASMKRTVANMRLAFAVTIGDEVALRATQTSPLSSHTAYDAFLINMYSAMLAAWDRRWHDFLAQLRNAEPVSPAQRSLNDALVAVAAAATRDDGEARARWRRAVHRLAHGSTWNLSDTRIRRLARALACSAGAVIGDVARAHRAVVPLLGTRQVAVFNGEPEPTYAGFQRVVSAMRESRKASEPAIVLTPAQTAMLKALATDASISEIAREDPERRSVATIRSHVQHLYEVLEVHSRTAAVLKAKELLLL